MPGVKGGSSRVHASKAGYTSNWTPILLYKGRPHTSPDKEVAFWKGQAPAIHATMLKYKLHIDEENSAHLAKMDYRLWLCSPSFSDA